MRRHLIIPFIIFISIIYYLPSQSVTIFNCGPSSSCSSVNSCPANEDCHITCNGDESCQYKTFNCPSNAQCIIQCGTNINDNKSCYGTLFTTKPDTTLINITTFGTNSMTYSTVFCPMTSHSTHSPTQSTNNCYIYALDGQSQLSNIEIYTVESYNDIYIYCKNTNHCYGENSYPSIHCSDHSSTCDLELTSNDQWRCTSTTASSQCNANGLSFAAIPTTNTKKNISTTTAAASTLTSSTWTKSTNYGGMNNDSLNVNDIDANNVYTNEAAMEYHMEAIVMGSILASAFCFVIILLCIIVIYLNNTNSAALTKIARRRSMTKEIQRTKSKSSNLSDRDTNNMNVGDTDGILSGDGRGYYYDKNSNKFIHPKRRVHNLPKPKPRINQRLTAIGVKSKAKDSVIWNDESTEDIIMPSSSSSTATTNNASSKVKYLRNNRLNIEMNDDAASYVSAFNYKHNNELSTLREHESTRSRNVSEYSVPIERTND